MGVEDDETYTAEDIIVHNCRSLAVPITTYELDRLKADGQGVELAPPCAGRALGFAARVFDWKIPPLVVAPPAAVIIDGQPAPVTVPIDQTPDSVVRDQLTLATRVCPYRSCRSSAIRLGRTWKNIGEFVCDACRLPFRLSTAGDLYLYDPALNAWERVTMGLRPNFFTTRG